MKKSLLIMTLAVTFAATTVIAGCNKKTATSETVPASEPLVVIENTGSSEVIEEPVNMGEVSQQMVSAAGRADGERFPVSIMVEGMEDTVTYEHAINETAGFEVDFDVDSLVRESGPDRELFISIYEDPRSPEDYLEITFSNDDADTVAASIAEELSKDYDIIEESYTLENAGVCKRIDASADKNGLPADNMQTVYIIPAEDGCRVATAHYVMEAAEGFGSRFAQMMQTLYVIKRN